MEITVNDAKIRNNVSKKPVSMTVPLTRPSVNADPFGRYYTAEWVSNTLINSIPDVLPSTIIELGAGSGALTAVAAARWQNAQLITVDLDSKIHEGILAAGVKTLKHKHHVQDALDKELQKKISLKLSSVDIAICNPPYIRPKWRSSFTNILEEAGLTGGLKSIYDAGADVLFIAQNLRFLRDGGRLGIILPDGIVSGEKYEGLRRLLLENHRLETVIQLPRRVFSLTEVQTHLLVLQKGASTDEQINLQSLNSEGVLSRKLKIPAYDAGLRLDFDFHFASKSKTHYKKKYFILGEKITELTRGSIHSKEVREGSLDVFHTDSFPIHATHIRLPWTKSQKSIFQKSIPPHYKIAGPGDILVARVGRNFNNKICIVKNGFGLISDCVFLIKAPEKPRKDIFRYLTSADGQEWLKAISRGTGARYITTSDLKQLKIPTIK